MTRKRSIGPGGVSRREFGKRLALASAAIGAPSNPVRAIAPHDRGGHHDSAIQVGPALDKLSAEGRARFESMWQNVLRKHGERLTDDQKTRMRKIIAYDVTLLDAVYAVPLKNGDTPPANRKPRREDD
jgi:hypothetical protein